MIDLNSYRRIAKPVIKTWCDEKNEEPPYKHISALAQYIPCPCIAVAHFMIELYGESAEILRSLNILNDFYKEEVKGFLSHEEILDLLNKND